MRLKHVLGFAKKVKISAIIHCGDWDNIEAVRVFCDTDGIPVYGVLGNSDIDPQIITSLKKANIVFNPDFLELELGGKKIGVSHFPEGLKEAVESQKYDVLFCGHIHSKYKRTAGKTLIVRPGALDKIINPLVKPSFAVYETKANDVEFVDLAI